MKATARRKRRKSPWQRIRDAGEKGRGLRLEAEEVAQLCGDDAIMKVAHDDDLRDEGKTDEEIWP